MDASLKKFFQKPEPEKNIPIHVETQKFFLKLAKTIERKSKLDYTHIKSKKYLKDSSIEQIRQEQNLERFLEDAKMTKEQFLDESLTPKAVERWQFKLGELLVTLNVWDKLIYQL